MKETNGTRDRIERRSLLERVSAATTGTVLGAASVASAGANDRVDRIELETDAYPAVEHASVAREVAENGIRYRYRLRTTRDVSDRFGPGGAETRAAEQTQREYSFSFGGDAAVLGTYATGGAWKGDEHGVSLETDETSVANPDVSARGVPDEPATGDWDGVVWAETNSRECGTLVRTNHFVDVCSTTGGNRTRLPERTVETHSADGEPCDGEEFGDHFPCELIPPTLRDDGCEVGEQFNTTWNVESAGIQRHVARAAFANDDFPYLAGTSHAEHTVRVAGFDAGRVAIDRTVTHRFESALPEPVTELVQSSINEYLLTPSFGARF